MITIDMPMPESCAECRFNTSEFGYCNAMPANYCGQVADEGKPEWCPLKCNTKEVIKMTASEAKKIVGNRVEREVDIIMSLVDNFSRLGFRSFSLDEDVAGLHPRTLRIIEQEGFDVVKSHETLVSGEVEKDLIYISWY